MASFAHQARQPNHHRRIAGRMDEPRDTCRVGFADGLDHVLGRVVDHLVSA